MVKKGLFILALAAIAVGGAAAQDDGEEKKGAFKISAGAGGFFGSDFGGGFEVTGSMSGQEVGKYTMKTPSAGGGGFIFLDATYAELNAAFFGGSVKSKVKQEGGGVNSDQEDKMSGMTFNLGLLGKYPVAVNEKLKVFPLLGIEYDICLSLKDENGNELESVGDYSALWFKLGGGLDFALSEKLYLRFETLYGLRLANKMEKDQKDSLEKQYANIPGVTVDAKTRLGHGLTAKLALGFVF
jgi:hypothetical protein